MSSLHDDEDPRCAHCRKSLSRLARVCPRCAHRVTVQPTTTTAEPVGWYKAPSTLPPKWQ